MYPQFCSAWSVHSSHPRKVPSVHICLLNWEEIAKGRPWGEEAEGRPWGEAPEGRQPAHRCWVCKVYSGGFSGIGLETLHFFSELFCVIHSLPFLLFVCCFWERLSHSSSDCPQSQDSAWTSGEAEFSVTGPAYLETFHLTQHYIQEGKKLYILVNTVI